MPDYNVTSPDGQAYKVTAPDGATPDQIKDYAKKNMPAKESQPMAPNTEDKNPGLAKGFGNLVGDDIGAAYTAADSVAREATFGFSDPAADRIQAFIVSEFTGKPYKEMLEQAEAHTKEMKEWEGEKHPVASTLGGFVGEARTAGLGMETKAGKAVAKAMKDSGMIKRGLIGGGVGGASGALSGAGHSDTGHRAEGAEIGGAGGTIAGTAGATVGQAVIASIAPKFDKAVKLLQDAGVKLTPGMMSVGTADSFKRIEGALKSLPFVGSQIRAGITHAFETFNTAILNKGLEQVGEKLPKDIEPGRPAIAKAESIIGDKYDKLLPKLSFRVTADLDKKMTVFENSLKAGGVSDEIIEKLKKTINGIVEPRLEVLANAKSPLSVVRGLTGKRFKEVEQAINEIRNYSALDKSMDNRIFADALYKFQGLLKDALEEQNPAFRGQLQKINAAWAAFARARDASSRRVTSGGLFSPRDLLQEIKKSSTKGVFARGDGLLQDIADAGAQVLPDTVPDSGTAERGMLNLMTAPAMVPGAIAATAYTKPGMSLVNKWAQGGTSAGRQAMRKSAEGLLPAFSEVGGAELGGLGGIEGDSNGQ